MFTTRYSNSRRLEACLLAGFCLCLISSALAQDRGVVPSSPADEPSAPGIRIDDGLLTLQVEDTPLAEVLQAIGKAAPFRVAIRGALEQPVSVSFSARPLEGAIRELVGKHTLIVIRADSGSTPGTPPLSEIRVVENRSAMPVHAAEPPAQRPVDGDEDHGQRELMTDREALRLASRGLRPPTEEDVRLALREPDQATRVAAVPKVGSLPPRAALGVLSSVFAEETDPLVRSRAVGALRRLDGPAARGLLRERALADDDPALRMQALNALASSRGERSVNVVAQALRQDPEPKVRLTAIRALGRVGGDWARRYLEQAVVDLDPEISFAAEQALASWTPHPD